MYPLDGKHTLAQVINRASGTKTVDNAMVATSTELPYDLVDRYASMAGTDVVRGRQINRYQLSSIFGISADVLWTGIQYRQPTVK